MKNDVVVECPPLKDLELYVMSMAFRVFLAVRPNEPLDVLKILEKTMPKIFGDDYAYEVTSDSEWKHGNNIVSVCIPSMKQIELRESVYIGAMDNNKEDLFSVSHEEAHILLAQVAKIKKITISKQERQRANVPPECDIEAFADKCALFMLCPLSLVEGKSAKDISQVCRVPQEKAAEIIEIYSKMQGIKEIVIIENLLSANFSALSERLKVA